MSAAHLLGDLIQYGHLADVIESYGRVLMPERPARHQAEEEHAGLVVEPGGDVKICQRRAEQIVDVRYSMQDGVGVDTLRAVEEGHDEGHHAVVGQKPAPDDE